MEFNSFSSFLNEIFIISVFCHFGSSGMYVSSGLDGENSVLVYLSVFFPCLSAVFRISGYSLDPRSLTFLLPVDFVTVLKSHVFKVLVLGLQVAGSGCWWGV